MLMPAAPDFGPMNPLVENLEETGIVEVAQHGWDRQGLIPLWFGEGDLPTPAFITEAAADAMRRGETFYTDQRGILDLRKEIAAYMNRTFDIALDTDRVSLTTGGMSSLAMAMQMILAPGDEVLVIGPIWPNIYSTVEINGGVSTHVSLSLRDDDWHLDMDELFAAVTDRTKAIFVNSPGNPTGWMIEQEQQQQILDFARERGIWIIADEVYHQLVFDRDVAPSFLQIAEDDDRLFVINSFSKSWMMTGWRLGWLTHPAALGPTVAKLVQIVTSGVPQFLHRGAIVAMRDGDHVIKQLRDRCLKGRDIVFDRLDAWPRISSARPKAAFYAFFTVDGMDDSVAACKEIIDKCNVGLAPGSAFGPSGEGYLRLCYASAPERLTAAMDALEGMLGGPKA
ncbi:pyridoxal phosphate-dependent aminotransferase [Nisaea denitrificans]|uniref:pyridoxal phosphate-dependent aminotransferase n=1 Tax=Nisaea denitrificans TaxID=390877 RepID=UPI000401C883|nr:pyridoxal phosphate-dependent aminotransferase [Nisaea denitrificans]